MTNDTDPHPSEYVVLGAFVSFGIGIVSGVLYAVHVHFGLVPVGAGVAKILFGVMVLLAMFYVVGRATCAIREVLE